jgi:IrrE N-terminal-like domain
MRLQHFIDRLEQFSALHGVAVFRTPLSPWVLGRMDEKQIVLRSGLSKERQLLTLLHELTHFLAHTDPHLDRTVCEYEAEAVEKLVAGQLGLKDAMGFAIDLSEVTDDLLACSVARVRRVARTLLSAALETQAAVEI